MCVLRISFLNSTVPYAMVCTIFLPSPRAPINCCLEVMLPFAPGTMWIHSMAFPCRCRFDTMQLSQNAFADRRDESRRHQAQDEYATVSLCYTSLSGKKHTNKIYRGYLDGQK